MAIRLEQISDDGSWVKISDNFEYLVESEALEILARRTTERAGMYYGVGGKI